MLDGLHILDLSGITAGGRTTQIMADYGAEVIKLEGPRRPDPFRHWTVVTGSTGFGDLGNPAFRVVNRNKRGVAVDLKHPDSRDIVRRLVERTDVVVENFRRGVLDRLGLGYATLREWNPRVVLLSLSSQGGTGPERGYVSFGSTLEALGGLMSMTGYDETTPTWSTNKVNYPDQIVSVLAPGLAAWGHLRSRETGQGCWIDLSQRETVTSMLGEWLLATSATGAAPTPTANRGPDGTDFCVPCAGEDEWVAISLGDDRHWAASAAVVGVTDDRFGDAAGRRAGYAEVEKLLAVWAAGRDGDEAASRLAAAGVPAAKVAKAHELVDRFAAAGVDFYIPVGTPDGGSERQISWAFDVTPDGGPAVRRRAPHVGEHTREVLGELGYAPVEVDDLFARGVVADRVVA
ncbi:CaiB/BaiF CoA transferase family protein [Rhizomonospora bruguierae]|uniref:CaiB/BaiF CoA transferase family protein n=1 Tax=Rhizomonospora bruguierae TaxID=1581705 RepID=UPI0020C08B8A|nr:CoA transferase [Micromonospora sp. NBRC 107566]